MSQEGHFVISVIPLEGNINMYSNPFLPFLPLNFRFTAEGHPCHGFPSSVFRLSHHIIWCEIFHDFLSMITQTVTCTSFQLASCQTFRCSDFRLSVSFQWPLVVSRLVYIGSLAFDGSRMLRFLLAECVVGVARCLAIVGKSQLGVIHPCGRCWWCSRGL